MKTNRKFSAGRVVTLRSPFHTEAALQVATLFVGSWFREVAGKTLRLVASLALQWLNLYRILARKNQIEIQAANAVRIEGTMLVFYAKK